MVQWVAPLFVVLFFLGLPLATCFDVRVHSPPSRQLPDALADVVLFGYEPWERSYLRELPGAVTTPGAAPAAVRLGPDAPSPHFPLLGPAAGPVREDAGLRFRWIRR